MIKAFVRQLPEPIVGKDLQHEWEKLGTAILKDPILMHNNDLTSLLKRLPKVNRLMLKELFHLLHLISMNRQSTRMDAENLATCWTPNLFPIDIINLVRPSPAFRVIIMMIDYSDDVFTDLE